jgi:hypothetical protein
VETSCALTQLYHPHPQPQDHCMLALFQVQPPLETSFTLAQNCWSMRSAANSGSVYSYFSNLSTANPPEETARTLTQLYQPYPQPQDHCMLALFQVQPPVETSFTLAQNCWSMNSAASSGSVYYCCSNLSQLQTPRWRQVAILLNCFSCSLGVIVSLLSFRCNRR